MTLESRSVLLAGGYHHIFDVGGVNLASGGAGNDIINVGAAADTPNGGAGNEAARNARIFS